MQGAYSYGMRCNGNIVSCKSFRKMLPRNMKDAWATEPHYYHTEELITHTL